LFSGVVISALLVMIFFKGPLLLGLKLLDMDYLLPILAALSACIADLIRQCLTNNAKYNNVSRLLLIFEFSLIISSVFLITAEIFDYFLLLQLIHSNLLMWLNLDFSYIFHAILPFITLIAWEVFHFKPILEPIIGNINIFTNGNSGNTS
jgi:hypothetical protein